MTRTERAANPRALVRDRSESKSGLDKSMRKNGSGQHNWGSLADEQYLETAGYEDEQRDFENATGVKPEAPEKPDLQRKDGSFTEEERETARKFRKNILKGQDVDLSAIARTSPAVSTSPPTTSPIVRDADTKTMKEA
ncbi:hypothetical protein CONPUDRAFT_137915 [Coniophora puteana RWD-64-598 SS2]|uniref:Hyaluronan/mRNA-binding protein domain-containing protein n=1 Tax=Coniophora puteana (strain RWD-64-598) TaxID=741705 RepID=A0A5M3MKX4_CONPW|nr:uncharacterized protein CONPUDRAFT_137915 [Coniophora puteana RWD-64-598 SS2]EIW79620.1 hypothetical protein CONPUDRAFT_137915 [Coniophora puteana RWD-64-598 SS2]